MTHLLKFILLIVLILNSFVLYQSMMMYIDEYKNGVTKRFAEVWKYIFIIILEVIWIMLI